MTKIESFGKEQFISPVVISRSGVELVCTENVKNNSILVYLISADNSSIVMYFAIFFLSKQYIFGSFIKTRKNRGNNIVFALTFKLRLFFL